MQIVRALGIAGAARASGTVIVIDTFRAFTTAAVLMSRGVDPLYLAADLDEARSLASSTGALLCGEDRGRKPADFDLGNSPAEASDREGLTARAVVQRTTAGTRSVIAALDAGAGPVYAASLVVATATALAVADAPSVTIVAAGLHGVESAVEDERTADLIEDILVGEGDPRCVARDIAASDAAHRLATAPWAHPDDVTIATDVDRHPFAMRAERTPRGRIVLRSHRTASA
jgi:2-phosphosulfolactate phosphatase